MFKQVFRITFLTYVWKSYKRAILSTLLLFVYLWLVGKIHGDFLDYARLQQNEDVGTSFIVKWIALILGTLIYLIYHMFRRDSLSSESNDNAPIDPDADDPFEQFRHQDKLRSRADIILEENSRE